MDFPAIMADGRAYTDWQPGAVINEQLRKRGNIKTNWDYRMYIQNNADSIMSYDRTRACDESFCSYSKTMLPPHTTSDLKDIYLSRRELQNRIIPHIVQSSVIPS